MGIHKLLKKLNKNLNKVEKDDLAHCEQVNDLLRKIHKRKDDLEKLLKKERNVSKKKKLKIGLKIVELQLKKGESRRRELMQKCQY